MDVVRVASLAKLALAALKELVGALEETPAAAPKMEPRRILGWATADREDLLKTWYPTYAPSSMIFRAIREMDGIDPGTDGNMQTYANARLKLVRPPDIRRNDAAVAADAKKLSAAMGWGDVVKVARRSHGSPAPAPAPVPAARANPAGRLAVPAAVRPVAGDWPAPPAGTGGGIWHSWANIKELARRDGWPLEEREQLPTYNKSRERRNLPPLYIKTIPPKGGFNA